MTLNYPAIRFGLRVRGNADFYDVLSKSSDFPGDAETVFRQRVCQSVEWTYGGSSGEPYPDSFLFWKLASATQILVARLIDAGSDLRGRPHSIGIEAVVVDTGSVDIPAAEFLARLIRTPDWSGETVPEEPGDPRHVENIERYLSSDAVSLLLASHSYFQVSGIDRVCSPERPAAVWTAPKPVIPPRPFAAQSKAAKTQKRIGLCFFGGGFMMLAVFVVLSSFLGWLAYSLDMELQRTRGILTEAHEEQVATEEQLKTLAMQLIKTEENLIKAEESLQNREAEVGRLHRENRELTDQLDTARRDADEGLKGENAELKHKNQQYREGLERVREVLNDLLD